MSWQIFVDGSMPELGEDAVWVPKPMPPGDIHKSRLLRDHAGGGWRAIDLWESEEAVRHLS